MLHLPVPQPPDRPLRILALGAHSDDIEIGCGGLLLQLLESRPVDVCCAIATSTAEREAEARASADELLGAAVSRHVVIGGFHDGYLPYSGPAVKDFVHDVASAFAPDLVLTHYGNDRHQDHRLISELAWNAFRDHLILEFEIPKYDGDMGAPNLYVPLGRAECERKVELLKRHFGSQLDKPWFDENTFLGLMRIRGVECLSASGFAEAFYSRKLVLEPSGGAGS